LDILNNISLKNYINVINNWDKIQSFINSPIVTIVPLLVVRKRNIFSNNIGTSDLKKGQKRLLTTNNPLIVPSNTILRLIITSNDVLHA